MRLLVIHYVFIQKQNLLPKYDHYIGNAPSSYEIIQHACWDTLGAYGTAKHLAGAHCGSDNTKGVNKYLHFTTLHYITFMTT